jgi:chloride channel 3/4/5
MNSYPFLNNKTKPIFTSDLADILPRLRRERIIDVSVSPLVPASTLRQKILLLQEAGEVDGGLPIVRDDILVGLIPCPDLEFALDTLKDEDGSLCLMSAMRPFDDDDDGDLETDPTDFTAYIDPVSCNHSKLALISYSQLLGSYFARCAIT